MTTSIQEFENWLNGTEGVNLEFKKSHIDRSKDLPDYCAALANEGGGKLVLGVDDSHHVVGTNIFEGTHHVLTNEILNKIGLRVDVEILNHKNNKRIVIFHVPPRQPGIPVRSSGNYTYPMRAGSSLTEMDQQTLKKIFDESEPDFTASCVTGLEMTHLDAEAIALLRKKWAEKAKRNDYLGFDDLKILQNLGLISNDGITYAALLLLGSRQSLQKFLPDAEIVFEWRHNPTQTNYDYRINWRDSFIKIDDEIWQAIDARNIRIPLQDGFFQREIFAFDEKSMREAVHNAVMHRNYKIKGHSIFVLASPEKFDIESPGAFLPGITPENALYKKAYRNRLLAEVMEKIGLVERSSQGLDDIFEKSICDGKGLPDLSKSDLHSVRLVIPAQVKDKNFILFLERIMNEKQASLSFEQIYELEQIRESKNIGSLQFKDKFLDLGLIEKIGHGRGVKYILSKRYYTSTGQAGLHTRLKGLPRVRHKELILQHLKDGKKGKVDDFLNAFPDLSAKDISNLLQELKHENKIEHIGSKRTGYWKYRAGF